MSRTRTAVIALVLAPGLLAGCSSSGGSGSGVSQSQLESKIKSEPSIQTLLKQGGAKASVTKQLVSCIATALEKDAKPADLKNYVAGKLTIEKVGAKSKTADNQAATDAKTCASQVVSKASSSANS